MLMSVFFFLSGGPSHSRRKTVSTAPSTTPHTVAPTVPDTVSDFDIAPGALGKKDFYSIQLYSNNLSLIHSTIKMSLECR